MCEGVRVRKECVRERLYVFRSLCVRERVCV
jgi:hypothetical protein